MIDSGNRLDDAILQQIAERKLLHPFLPRRLGGEELSLFNLVLSVEELAKACPALGWLVSQQVILGIRLNQKSFNFEDNDERMLAAANLKSIYSVAATESEAGSDLSSVLTASSKDGDYYILNGEKSCVNWAKRAAFFITLARSTSPDAGQGVSVFVVPASAPGLSTGEALPVMGLGGLEGGPVRFSNCRVEANCLAGIGGFGFDLFDAVVNELRIAVSAIATGISSRAFDTAASHAKTRKQFGKPVGSFQSLQWRFADAALKVDASRLHVWHAVEMADQKRSCFQQAAMAKVYASEAAFEVTNFAFQVLAGKAFVKPNTVERLFRDARFLQIALGTSEILRNKIAQHL